MIKRIEQSLSNGDYTKINTRFSEAITVMDGNKNYNCKVIVDDIFDENGLKVFRVERHIENEGDYEDTIIFDYQKNVYL